MGSQLQLLGPKLYTYKIIGKSILSSAIIEFLRDQPNTATIFFFCPQEFSRGQTYLTLLKVAISQLLRRDFALIQHVYDQYVEKNLQPSQQIVEKLRSEIFDGFPSVCWIVDGLDGCDSAAQSQILPELLVQCTYAQGSLKILFSCRDSPEISIYLGDTPKIALGGVPHFEHMSKDIGRLIHSKVTGLQAQFDSQELNNLEVALYRRADGELIS